MFWVNYVIFVPFFNMIIHHIIPTVRIKDMTVNLELTVDIAILSSNVPAFPFSGVRDLFLSLSLSWKLFQDHLLFLFIFFLSSHV